jgi:hypothetical protein
VGAREVGNRRSLHCARQAASLTPPSTDDATRTPDPATQELADVTEADERAAAEKRVKSRTLGTVRLIAELFRKDVVSEAIVLVCVRELLEVSACPHCLGCFEGDLKGSDSGFGDVCGVCCGKDVVSEAIVLVCVRKLLEVRRLFLPQDSGLCRSSCSFSAEVGLLVLTRCCCRSVPCRVLLCCAPLPLFQGVTPQEHPCRGQH